ncbi:hypothetical protein NC797_14895 [Aquibacillus sp. 3ASR75-11]|uniref:Uncharacterized protein n=1 Tax=Terrihalobacillus insolitus TaxID=2950438 RepID=A0A9X3WWE7_9BACI|nr:hypothetical protein [Terrihalobacillus insolitus]MDC3414317.1 hypothetical protein [Terrihalobacillus insolitus]MDC3425793.1 hypothetical protein [Terrihalobacillus insolitus]
MKPYKIIRISIKELFTFKKIWLAIIVYCFVVLPSLMLIARNGAWSDRGIFDLIADVGGALGSTNHHMFYIVAIPIIVTIITQLIEKHEGALYVITFGSRFRAWHSHVTSVVCLSFILTFLILTISFLVGGLFVGMDNTWVHPSGTIGKLLNDREEFQSLVANVTTYKIVFSLFITKFLGFLMISFFALFLKQFIKSGALIMIILIGLAGLDQTGAFIPIFTWRATLSINNWLDPIVTIYNSIYLLIVSLVLYAITGWLYERKDFLS